MINVGIKFLILLVLIAYSMFILQKDCIAESNVNEYWNALGLKSIVDVNTKKVNSKFTAKIIDKAKLAKLGLKGAPDGALVEITNLGKGKWHIKLLQLGSPIDKEIIIENLQVRDDKELE